ncbi:MAG: outer membrane protein transport protein [Rhodocyclaceae bacterium]|nr:outer membrane protein transport protein [Rhodocyclaceae bacterium]MDZ4214736.1 outer membrane protein transport protein [Rhodocyclaceae bacterium]
MKLKKLAVLIAAAGLSTSAFATNGYFSHGYGIKAKSMGGVGIALPQDAMAAATNPAGMALVGNKIDFGLDLFSPIRSATWTGTGTNPMNGAYMTVSAQEYKSGKNLFAVPEFGYNRMINKDMSFGVVVYGNGGMNTDYGKVVIAGATTNTYSNLEQMFIAPTIAWKINQNHSIGVSLNLVFQNFEARGLESFDNTNNTTAVGSVTNRGTDYSRGLGLKLGWTGKLTNSLTMGATYQPKTSMTRFDKYKGLFAEQGKFDIPETLGIGFAYQANDKLTVAGDVVQINYGDIKSLANNGDAFPSLAGTPMGGNNGSGFGWKDQTVFKIGMTYQYAPDLMLRAGYNYAKAPIGNTQTFFNILAPATVESHLTLGATWALANKSELTVSYMHAFNNKISGPSNGNGTCGDSIGTCPAQTRVAGHPVDLKMHQNAIGIAYGWKM